MKNTKQFSILYAGSYLTEYPRNYIFLKSIRNNNIKVYEFNFQKGNNAIRNILYFLKNLKKLLFLNYDAIIFSSVNLNPTDFFLIKILSYIKRVPLIHDIFISKLETFYYDRKLMDKLKFLKVLFFFLLYFFDKFECALSKIILLDTYSHIKFFHEKFNINLKKVKRVIVGARDDMYYPQPKVKMKENEYIVGFWGSFIPLHGVDYILRAAKLLIPYKDINFILTGDGQTYEENLKLAENLSLKNIKFIRKNFLAEGDVSKLVELISTFSVGLGIFGKSDKASQVIPNKFYEGIAMKIPMITADTPAIRELFSPMENIILCDRDDPRTLSQAILNLKNDFDLRKKIALNGYNLFNEYCSIEKIGKRIVKILNDLI